MKQKSVAFIYLFTLFVILISGCSASRHGGNSEISESFDSEAMSAVSSEASITPQAEESIIQSEENTMKKITLQIGGSVFTATLENNDAADTLADMLNTAPITISMNDYSGFEKVGSLGTNLPTSNSQTTTHAGDIVLYNGNQIVIFYGSNSWSYTRLGSIDDLSGWEDALGGGDITVTFSLAK